VLPCQTRLELCDWLGYQLESPFATVCVYGVIEMVNDGWVGVPPPLHFTGKVT
jgi:hypothetical protein